MNKEDIKNNKEINKKEREKNKINKRTKAREKFQAESEKRSQIEKIQSDYIRDKIQDARNRKEEAEQRFKANQEKGALKKAAHESKKIELKNLNDIKQQNYKNKKGVKVNHQKRQKNISFISNQLKNKSPIKIARFKNTKFLGKSKTKIGLSAIKKLEKRNVISCNHREKKWEKSKGKFGREFNRDLFHALRNKYIFDIKLTQEQNDLLNDFEKIMNSNEGQIKELILNDNYSNDLSNIIAGLSALNFEKEYFTLEEFNEKYQTEFLDKRKEYEDIASDINKSTTSLRNEKQKIIYIYANAKAESETKAKFDIEEPLSEYLSRKYKEKEKSRKNKDFDNREILNKEIKEIEGFFKSKRKHYEKEMSSDIKVETGTLNKRKRKIYKYDFNILNKYRDYLNEKEIAEVNKKIEEYNESEKNLNNLKERRDNFKDEYYDVVENSNDKPMHIEQMIIIPEWQYEQIEKEIGADGARLVVSEAIEKFMFKVEQKTGLKPANFALHLDEGHIDPETGNFSRNIHAHAIYFNYDFKNKVIPTIELSRQYKRNNTFKEYIEQTKNDVKKYGYNSHGKYNAFEENQDILYDCFKELGFSRGLRNRHNPFDKKVIKNNDEFFLEQISEMEEKENSFVLKDKKYEDKKNELIEKVGYFKKEKKSLSSKENKLKEQEKDFELYKKGYEDRRDQEIKDLKKRKKELKENQDTFDKEKDIELEKISAERERLEKENKKLEKIKESHSAVKYYINKDIDLFYSNYDKKYKEMLELYKQIKIKEEMETDFYEVDNNNWSLLNNYKDNIIYKMDLSPFHNEENKRALEKKYKEHSDKLNRLYEEISHVIPKDKIKEMKEKIELARKLNSEKGAVKDIVILQDRPKK